MADLSSYKYKNGAQTEKTFKDLFVNTSTSYSTYISPDNNSDIKHYGTSTNTGAKSDEPSNYFYINDTNEPLARHIYYPPIATAWGVENIADGLYKYRKNFESIKYLQAIKRGYTPTDIKITGVAAGAKQSGDPENPPAPIAVNALVNSGTAKLFTYSFTGTSYPNEETVNIVYDSTEDDFRLTVNGSAQYLNIKGVLGYTPRVLGFAACGAGGRGSSSKCGGGGAGTAIFLVNFDIVKRIDMQIGAGYASSSATSTVITIKSNVDQREVTTTITCGAGSNAGSSAGDGGTVSIATTTANLQSLGIQRLAEISGTAGTSGKTTSSDSTKISQTFKCFNEIEAKSQLSTAGATTNYYGVGGSSLGQGGYAPSSTTARYPYFGGGGRGQNGGSNAETRRGGPGGFLIWY